MKLTSTQIKRIIREEVAKVLDEREGSRLPDVDIERDDIATLIRLGRIARVATKASAVEDKLLDKNDSDALNEQDDNDEPDDELAPLDDDEDDEELELENEAEVRRAAEMVVRRVRSKSNLTIREAGIGVNVVAKLMTSELPRIDWFEDKFSEEQIMEAGAVLACYVQAAFDEHEKARPHLERLVEQGNSKAEEALKAFDKMQAIMDEQRSKGKLDIFDDYVEAAKKGESWHAGDDE